jgi:hypothetical protein
MNGLHWLDESLTEMLTVVTLRVCQKWVHEGCYTGNVKRHIKWGACVHLIQPALPAAGPDKTIECCVFRSRSTTAFR